MSRNKKKSPIFLSNLILSKKKKKPIKLFQKNLIILPEYISYIFSIYNGKIFIPLKIQKNMVGYKMGEFISTRKRFFYKKK